MPKTIKVIIIIMVVLIAVLAIAAPIYFYVKDFQDIPRSKNASDWGPFGDFFGGILNPIISFLTLIVTIIIAVNISKIEKRNHEETIHRPVQPLFTIGTGDFFSSDISQNGLTVEKDFYSYSPPQAPAGSHDYLSNGFYVNISNKGLGVATHVSITFEIALEQLRKLLCFDDPRIKITVSEIRVEDDGRKFIALAINSEEYNYQGSSKIWEKERIGWEVVNKGEEIIAPFPSQIMHAFNLYNLIRRLKNDIEAFPTIYATLNYKNMYGKEIPSKFIIGLRHIHDYPNYSLFRLLQEQIS